MSLHKKFKGGIMANDLMMVLQELLKGVHSIEDLNNLKMLSAKKDEEFFTGVAALDFPSKDDGFIFFDSAGKPKPDYDGLAKYLIETDKLKSSESVIYIYKEGRYQSITNMYLQYIINELIEENSSPAKVQNYARKALILSQTDFNTIREPKNLLNCRNGVLNVKTGELAPPTHKHFFKYRLKHRFDAEAECPHFMNSLNLVTNGDKDLQKLMQQVFGYCIEGGSPVAQKAFLFFGDGGNGKSTILTALTSLIGKENVSHVPLNMFDKPFSMISLDGKLANIVDETPKKNINPEAFKNIVTGGYVRAAQKGKPEFDLKVHAKIIFACNSLPKFGDSSDGLRRRLIIIPFLHKFSEELADKGIDDKIKKEMSGIMNWSIGGLKSLRANGYRFQQAKIVDQAVEVFKKETDSVYDFLSQTAKFMDGVNGMQKFTSTTESFEIYLKFCRDSHNHPCSKNEFSRRSITYYKDLYLKHGHKLESRHRISRNGYKTVRGIKGIEIKYSNL